MLSHVLFVGTNTTYITLLRYRLESTLSIELKQVDTGREALDALSKATTLVVVAPTLPDGCGLQLIASMRAGWPDVPMLLMVHPEETQIAREALSHGVTDVVVAGRTDLDRMEWWIEQSRGHTATVAPPMDDATSIALAGDSLTTRRTRSRIRHVQQTDAPLLLSAESGLEPESWAQCMHNGSSRTDAPFVSFDGTLLSDDASADRLFGTADAPGACANAGDGTLFIENVTLLNASLQQQLVALVDTETIPSHAGRDAAPFQARLVCSTGHDADALSDEDMLTPDLHALLAPNLIRLPPLRERSEDLLLLAQELLHDRIGPSDSGPISFSVTAMDHLMAYDWPGNYRELESAIEHGLRTAAGLEMTAADLFPDEKLHSESDEVTKRATSNPAGASHPSGILSEATASNGDSHDESETVSDEHDSSETTPLKETSRDEAESGTTPAPRSLFDMPASDGAAADTSPQPAGSSRKSTPLERVAVQAPDAIIPLDELQVLAVEHALHVCDGDVKQAARALGVAPATISHVASQLVSSVSATRASASAQ